MLSTVANFAIRYRVSPMAKAESDILTIDEVASFLKVAERTVYRLAAAKRIPAFKVGGAWRFSRADLEAWIRQQSSLRALNSDANPVKTGR